MDIGIFSRSSWRRISDILFGCWSSVEASSGDSAEYRPLLEQSGVDSAMTDTLISRVTRPRVSKSSWVVSVLLVLCSCITSTVCGPLLSLRI